MAKSLKDLCKPRKSVFDRTRRDVVLDLTDLVENKIKADEFFDENYRTDGMRRLLKEAFRRFKGESQQGVFVLSQAMGGWEDAQHDRSRSASQATGTS